MGQLFNKIHKGSGDKCRLQSDGLEMAATSLCTVVIVNIMNEVTIGTQSFQQSWSDYSQNYKCRKVKLEP